ncbi:MAG: PAS domain S-box protein [Burkholderiaceae bacterium]|nr:PAS domain S-box protein [Burkholderiaceae bacterium]
MKLNDGFPLTPLTPVSQPGAAFGGLDLAEVAAMTSSAVVVADAEGRVEWINAGFTRLTGYTIDEIRGRKPGAVLQGPGTDPATVQQIRACLARGEGFSGIEILNYHKDGRPYWVLLEVQPVRDASGRVVRYVSTESDVTAQRAARERFETTARELGQLNALLAAAGRIARLGVWQVDLATRTPLWSDVTYDIHEVERGTPVDMARAVEFYAPEHQPVIERAVERAISNGEPWDLELKLVTARGREIWVRALGEPVFADGRLVSLRGVFKDIDAERNAAEALRAERARAEAAGEQLRVAIESLEDGFVLYDRDDRLVLFNERYREIYRASADLIESGSRFEDIIRAGVVRGQYPAARGREEQWIAERLANHRSADSTIEQKLPDGRWLRIAERRTPDGGVVGFRVDITELKRATEQAESAAREAARLSAQMNAIFELSPDGFIAFDAAGRATHANSALHALTGLAPEAIVGMPLAEFDRALAARCEASELYVTSDQVADAGSIRLLLHEPRAITLQRSVRSLRDRDGHLAGLVVYLRDVTDVLAAERDRLAQQAKFEAAFRHSADYLSIVRLSDHRFVDVNEGFEQLSGYTREEAIGRTAQELRLWTRPEQREEILRQIEIGGRVRDFPAEMRRKDGAIRQVVATAARIDMAGEPGVMWTVRDVTEQRAAGDALRASEAKFGAAFRNAVDHMVVSRLDDGRIVEVNEAFCRTVGRPREDVLGRTVLELGSWADPAQRGEALRLLRVNATLSNFPFRQRRHDGAVSHCLLSASIVTIDGERCVLSTTRDISERVEAEESARQLNKRLQVTVAALEEVNRQNAALSDMRDLLQTCQTPQEVHRVAAHFVPQLLPGTRGALYQANDSRTALEAIFAWHDDELRDSVFGAEACWALRRGRAYHVTDAHHALHCGHVHKAPRGGYICLPMVAQGENFGLMHVEYDGLPEDDPLQLENRESFLRTMTEHVALAMSNAKLRENLRAQASRDPLTGLVNRRFTEEAFEREISRCRRRNKPIAVFMIDIDHFKHFNDRHGHEAGDTVLKLVAAALAKSLRLEDIVCRYGGEEFLALLPETDERMALECAERVRSRVSELMPSFRGAPLGAVTVSIGVAIFPEQGTVPEALIQCADEALYEAKRAGRNRALLARPTAA